MLLSAWKVVFIAISVSAHGTKRCDCEDGIVDSPPNSYYDTTSSILSSMTPTPTITSAYLEELEAPLNNVTVTVCLMSPERSKPTWGPWYNTTRATPFQEPTAPRSLVSTASAFMLTPLTTNLNVFSNAARTRSWDNIRLMCWVSLMAFLEHFII
jgi:hypothetical protein